MGERNGGTAAARLQLVLEEEELPPCLERIREILGDDRSATKKVLPCGRSPLHVACDNPFIEKQVFDFLISEWPESVRLEHFDEDDPDIDLPIHVACYSGCSTAIIRALAEQYPESLKKPTTESSFTPLHLAALCTKRSLETIQFLAQQCPESVRARDRDGDLPLHDALRALRFGSEEPAPTTTELVKLEEPASTTADIVELLVDSFPESLMMRGDMERLPIHVACDRGAPLEVLKLVALGSAAAVYDSLETKDYLGRIPIKLLCRTAKYLSVEKLDFLLEWTPQSLVNGGELLCDFLSCAPRQTYSEVGIEIMRHLLDKFPGAAKHTDLDRRGEYPLHLLCGKVGTAHLETWITGLVDAHPSALFLENHNGKIPLDILKKRGLGEALLKERMSRVLWGALRKELEKHRMPRDVFDYILTFAL